MPVAGAVATIPAAATSHAVSSLNLSTPYEISGAPSWVTAWSVGAKTASGFTLTFAAPCPAGGGTFDWLARYPSVSGGGTATLGDYPAELRRLLHDENDNFWSAADKTAYINAGIQRRDLDSGQNRVLISKTLTAGTALYNFSDLSNDAVFDVIGIAVINGSTRIQLNQYSYSELSVAARAWTTYQSLPRAFARYGPSQVYLAPIPVSAYVSEWDCCVYSDPLVAPTDVDPLPFPYVKPVAYYAAYEAKRGVPPPSASSASGGPGRGESGRCRVSTVAWCGCEPRGPVSAVSSRARRRALSGRLVRHHGGHEPARA